MGIYADIQADLKEAMDDDLADATATLTITETVSSTSYDPLLGEVTATPVVNTMRCVIVDSNLKDETKPDSDTTIADLEVMVLDSERTTAFRVGLNATVRGVEYIVSAYEVDPAGATHTLQLRRG